MNNIIAVFKIANKDWLPTVSKLQDYAKEFDELIIGQSKSGIADIVKQMKQKYPDMQADLIRADTCRLKSNQINNFELLYVNPDYKNKFIIRKIDRNNEILVGILNQINENEANAERMKLKM